jgi:DNA-binding LytR/AlgR family response regulator
MRVLIIEDENRTALDLKSTIEEVEPGAIVLGIKDSVDDAVAWLQTNASPDLIFMDIQLADGLSFEIFQEVAVECPVIFCTAYDEYAVEAFRVNGVDYILKPFDQESISRALNKVKNLQNFFQRGDSGLNKLADLLNTLKPAHRTSFLVSHRDKLLPVSVNDIAFFYIEHEVTFLNTFDSKRYVVNHTMEELEKQLDPRQFYRANRQFLMNYTNVVEVEHYFARKLLVKTRASTKEPVIVSKAKATDFLAWMEAR